MAADGHLNFDTKINTKGFEKDADKLSDNLTKIKGAFKGLAAAAAAAFSIKQIAAFAKECKEAFNVQLEAETKLGQVLRNTTGATQEQIDAVKEWASELQEVGVIGDEITLSGLQELGTYIENADSLKTLSVVLDDMLAQQYGFNATAESAVTISTMLGKVLEGQTSALSRYGYKFTEAQEELLKYGTEEERVATLAEVVEASVGGMNQALAQTPTGRMKQLNNTMGDIKETFGQAFTNISALFLPALEGLTTMLSRAANLALQLSQSLADIFGIELNNAAQITENISGSVSSQEDLTDAVEDTAKAEQKSLAGFDKINKLSSSEADSKKKGAGGGGATTNLVPSSSKLGVDTSEANKKLKEFAREAEQIFSALGGWIDTNFSPTFEGIWAGLSGETMELFGTMKGIFRDIQSLGPPLLAYFQGDFTTYLQTAFQTYGMIAVGLFDTYNTVFADIWNLAVFPILSDFITLGLPVITQFKTESLLTLGVWFEEMKGIFDMLWRDAAKPALELIAKMWGDLMNSIKSAWDKWGAPIFEALRTAISNAADTFKKVWNNIIKPIFDTFAKVVDDIWSNHLKPLIDKFLDFVGTLVAGALQIYNEFIKPVVDWFVEKFGPPIAKVFSNLIKGIGKAIGSIIDFIGGIVDALKGVIDFVVGVFTGDWDKAWTGIKEIFTGIWDALSSFITAPLNAMIGFINAFLGVIETGVNWLIDCINSFSVDVPDWVPGIGGSHFGFDLDHVTISEIPYLAQGTVVPANYGNFLAMLGDNKREPEVVSPVSTIEKALENVLSRKGMRGTENIHVHVELDGREIGYVAVKAVNEDNERRGA